MTKIDFGLYFCKIIRGPVLWILIFIVLLYALRPNGPDSLAIPYPTASIPRGTSQKFLSSNFGATNRLGNHLFEVFSIFSIAQKLQRTPIFFIKDGYHEKMIKDVINVVPSLMEQFLVVNGSVPDFIQNTTFHTKCCKFENTNVLEKIDDEYLYLTGTHYQSWKYFPDRRDEFLGYLKPLKKRLYTLPQSNNFTFVKCVHIRRGDFPAFKIPVADRIFILNALKFIESKEKVSRQMTATVFFGDDFEFMHGLRADVPYSFVSQNEPVDDIFYAKNNCDLVLITAPAQHLAGGWDTSPKETKPTTWIFYTQTTTVSGRVIQLQVTIFYPIGRLLNTPELIISLL